MKKLKDIETIEAHKMYNKLIILNIKMERGLGRVLEEFNLILISNSK